MSVAKINYIREINKVFLLLLGIRTAYSVCKVYSCYKLPGCPSENVMKVSSCPLDNVMRWRNTPSKNVIILG